MFSGVTTMLNFFTTSNGFRSTLPVVSNLTAMNVWDGVCMCFIYASLLEFVCVNYVGRKRPLHNVVYRPGENPVTQVSLRPPLLRLFSLLFPRFVLYKIILRLFYAALSIPQHTLTREGTMLKRKQRNGENPVQAKARSLTLKSSLNINKGNFNQLYGIPSYVLI